MRCWMCLEFECNLNLWCCLSLSLSLPSTKPPIFCRKYIKLMKIDKHKLKLFKFNGRKIIELCQHAHLSLFFYFILWVWVNYINFKVLSNLYANFNGIIFTFSSLHRRRRWRLIWRNIWNFFGSDWKARSNFFSYPLSQFCLNHAMKPR